MSQPRCAPESGWTAKYLGDCAQHFNRNDSAYIISGFITYQGQPYKDIPHVIFMGGGNEAEGAIALPLMDKGTSGHVTGLRIINGGWHYIANPTFICTGDFAVDGEHIDCKNDKAVLCQASGYGLITGGHPFFENITLVKLREGSNPTVPLANPYTRREPGVCQDAHAEDCTSTNVYLCGPWTTGDIIACPLVPYGGQIASGKGGFRRLPHNDGIIKVNNGIGWNCYKPTTGVVDYGLCNKLGFKNVQARKSFHGSLGFQLSGDANEFDSRPTPNLLSPLGTRYLSLTASIDYTFTTLRKANCGVTSFNSSQSLSFSETTTIDRYKGTQSVVCSEGITAHYEDDGGEVVNDDWDTVRALSVGAGQAAGIGELKQSIIIGTDNGKFRFVTDSFLYQYDNLSPFDFINAAENPQPPRPALPPGVTVVASASLSRTNLTIDTTEFYSNSVSVDGCGINDSHTGHLVINLSFGSPYTSDQVIADATGLLNHIPLNDDVLYPWRYDQYVTIAPQLSYNEILNGVLLPAPVTDCIDFSDPNLESVDGSIMGEMLPAGYDSFFDFGHETFIYCKDINETLQVVPYGWGAYANTTPNVGASIDETDTVVPKNTTRWTNQVEASGYYVGAWITYDIDNKVVIAQKWAETIVRRPSFNYARPCGKDRFLPDERTMVCLLSVDEGLKQVIVNQDDDGNPRAIDTSKPLLVCGVSDTLNGLWSGSLVGDGVYQLNHLLLSGQYIPNINEYGLCNKGRFGNTLWPDKAPICSNLNISQVVSGTPTIVTVIEPVYLYDGDPIAITGVQGITDVNGPWTALISGNRQQVILSGSSINGVYTTGGAMFSPNSADTYWDDARPKGDFTVREYHYNFRDIALNPAARANLLTWGISQAVTDGTIVQDCLPFSICSPSVICISPNTGEVFTNGKTYPFYTGLIIDETYGSLWQENPIQAVTDPLWQQPSHPCYTTCTDHVNKRWESNKLFHEDNGSCQGDNLCDNSNPDVPVVMYYPHSPMIEAIDLPATGAYPALATGSIGCQTINYLIAHANPNPSSPPPFNVCLPPTNIGAQLLNRALPNKGTIDIHTYRNELDCVCGGGTFSGAYIDNQVICSGNQIVSPP